MMEPSGRGTPWWGMPGDISACWCMNPMGPRCVGGALYPLARRGDFSMRAISGTNAVIVKRHDKLVLSSLDQIIIVIISSLPALRPS